MGHKPNNGKAKHSRGLWSPDEDQKLADYIRNNGHACWSSIPAKAGLKRNGKSCRLRWINYLRPGLKKGTFTFEEREIVLTLHRLLGNKWAEISKYLPGRTDNEIKNYWHSNLKNRSNVKVADSWSLMPSHLVNSSMPSMSLQSLDTMNSGNSLTGSSSLGTASCQQETPATNFASGGGSIPKLLFTEWLSLDQQQQDAPVFLEGNGSPIDPSDCFNHFMSFQDCLLPELSYNESLFYSEDNQGNSLNYSPYGLMGLIEGQESGSGNNNSNPEGIFYSENGIY